MIKKTILHYNIIEKLGEGGMGVVYLAQDTRLERNVAIKFLPRLIAGNAEERRRFEVEAKSAAALNHPNIAHVYAIEEADDEMFIVMEYVDGQTLEDIAGITAGGSPLAVEKAVDIALQIARGLEAAHKKEIVHRDIKAANIMLAGDGQVKIMDFGVARMRGSAKITRAGARVGTAAYMSPEQALGAEVDQRSDIWSFGVVLYEMLTGRLPFDSEYEQVMLLSIMNDPPLPVNRDDVPPTLVSIIEKMLAKDPENRYQHTGELIADLATLAEPGTQRIDPRPQQPRRAMPSARRMWLSTAAVLLILLFAMWNMRRQDSPPASQAVISPAKSLAVMYFENRSREPDLDNILVDMLSTNLARRKDLEVLSSQRLFDILRKLGRLNEQNIDRSVATEVANYAGVNTLLMGSIIQIGDRIRINSQLVDVESGSIIGSEMVEGEKIEDIFSMVDVLTARLSVELGVATSETEGQILRVADVTTNSFEAYKQYQKGLEKDWRRELPEAIKYFQNAIAIDSTFALAYLYMARAQNNTVDPLDDLRPVQQILQKAEKFSAGASEKERLLIRAYKAFYSRDFPRAYQLFRTFEKEYPHAIEIWTHVATRYLGKPQEAIERLQSQSEIDPSFPGVYNELAYCYSQIGDHANAISSVKKYMALLPDISNAYDSAWDIYIQAGQLDEAMKVCQAALQKNPNWAEFQILTGYTQLFMGDGDTGRKTIRKAMELDPSQAAWFTKYVAFSYLFEGRYRDAAAELKKAEMLAMDAGQKTIALRTSLELAKLHGNRGNFTEAQKHLARARDFSKQVYDHPVNPGVILAEYLSGRLMILQGKYHEAQTSAKKILNMVTENNDDVYYTYYHHLLMAEIEIAGGRGAGALAALAEAVSMVHYYPRHHIMRAESHAINGDIETALATLNHFRNLIDTELYYMGGDAFDFYYERSLIDYRLGKLYEQNGETQKAAEKFSQFLTQWKNADADLPEISDAQTRLSKLNM